MDWLTSPSTLWITLAHIASVLGFANVEAKLDARGLFLGFPSYWNVVAFYVGVAASRWGPLREAKRKLLSLPRRDGRTDLRGSLESSPLACPRRAPCPRAHRRSILDIQWRTDRLF